MPELVRILGKPGRKRDTASGLNEVCLWRATAGERSDVRLKKIVNALVGDKEKPEWRVRRPGAKNILALRRCAKRRDHYSNHANCD